MADEIMVTTKLVYSGKEASNGPAGFTLPEKTWSVDQAGSDYTKGTQNINSTTAEQVVVSGDIGTQGLWEIRHLSAAGVVKFGLSGQTLSEMPFKMAAGDPPLRFRANGPIYAAVSASASPVQIDFVCFEA